MKTVAFDLDGILIFPEPSGIAIPGRTRPTYMHSTTADLLIEVSQRFQLYLATARSASSVFGLINQVPNLSVSGFVFEAGCVARRTLLATTVNPCHEFEELVQHVRCQLPTWQFIEGYERIICCVAPNDLSDAKAILDEIVQSLPMPNRWTLHSERRKLFLYPEGPCKHRGLVELGVTEVDAAAGDDWVYDRSMLDSAGYPMTLVNSTSQVRNLVRSKGGYVTSNPGHRGAIELLTHLLEWSGSPAI